MKWEMAPQNGINRRAGFAVSGTISCTGIGSSGGRGGASFFYLRLLCELAGGLRHWEGRAFVLWKKKSHLWIWSFFSFAHLFNHLPFCLKTLSQFPLQAVIGLFKPGTITSDLGPALLPTTRSFCHHGRCRRRPQHHKQHHHHRINSQLFTSFFKHSRKHRKYSPGWPQLHQPYPPHHRR